MLIVELCSIWLSTKLFILICRARLFDLAVSLLPGLNAKEIAVLFVAIKPALQVADSACVYYYFYKEAIWVIVT